MNILLAISLVIGTSGHYPVVLVHTQGVEEACFVSRPQVFTECFVIREVIDVSEEPQIVVPLTPEESLVIEKWKKTNKAIIPLAEAVLCESCKAISTANGEACPNCHAVGSLGNVSRMLAPNNEILLVIRRDLGRELLQKYGAFKSWRPGLQRAISIIEGKIKANEVR